MAEGGQHLGSEAERYYELIALSRVSAALSGLWDLDAILKVALDNVLKIMNGAIGGILLLDEQTQTLYYDVHEGLSDKYVAGICLRLGEGIAGKVDYTREDRLLRVRVEGCVHRQVEDKMAAHGIEPFTCVPANLIVLAIEEKLDRPVELAEIKLEDGACQLLLVVFDQRPTLG